MLGVSILNSSATLNSYEIPGSLNFIPGEQIRLVIQFFQADRSDLLRYMLPANATVTASLPKTDNTDASITFTVLSESNVEDRSIWVATIQETLTEDLSGGNFSIEIDELGDGTKITKAFAQNALSRIITGSC